VQDLRQESKTAKPPMTYESDEDGVKTFTSGRKGEGMGPKGQLRKGRMEICKTLGKQRGLKQ